MCGGRGLIASAISHNYTIPSENPHANAELASVPRTVKILLLTQDVSFPCPLITMSLATVKRNDNELTIESECRIESNNDAKRVPTHSIFIPRFRFSPSSIICKSFSPKMETAKRKLAHHTDPRKFFSSAMEAIKCSSEMRNVKHSILTSVRKFHKLFQSQSYHLELHTFSLTRRIYFYTPGNLIFHVSRSPVFSHFHSDSLCDSVGVWMGFAEQW